VVFIPCPGDDIARREQCIRRRTKISKRWTAAASPGALTIEYEHVSVGVAGGVSEQPIDDERLGSELCRVGECGALVRCDDDGDALCGKRSRCVQRIVADRGHSVRRVNDALPKRLASVGVADDCHGRRAVSGCVGSGEGDAQRRLACSPQHGAADPDHSTAWRDRDGAAKSPPGQMSPRALSPPQGPDVWGASCFEGRTDFSSESFSHSLGQSAFNDFVAACTVFWMSSSECAPLMNAASNCAGGQ